jgi:hexosaminidase
MRARWFAICVCFIAATVFGAEPVRPSVIPVPKKMEITNGQFRLAPVARIDIDEASAATGEYLAAKLRLSTGYRMPVYTNSEPLKGDIELTTQGAKADLGLEGYELDVAPDAVTIRASTQAGLFYGVQTLLQLFPPQIFSTNLVKNVTWGIPFAVQIGG